MKPVTPAWIVLVLLGKGVQQLRAHYSGRAGVRSDLPFKSLNRIIGFQCPVIPTFNGGGPKRHLDISGWVLVAAAGKDLEFSKQISPLRRSCQQSAND